MFSRSKNDKNNSYTTKIREHEYEYDHIRCSSDNIRIGSWIGWPIKIIKNTKITDQIYHNALNKTLDDNTKFGSDRRFGNSSDAIVHDIIYHVRGTNSYFEIHIQANLFVYRDF